MYDAFISYSHAKDRLIAAALQKVIQRLGKRWYQRRALRVFRDDTSLSASPHLWGSIQAALDDARFLILLVSEDSARSVWVNREIAHWLASKPIDTLLIALTSGDLVWAEAANDFVGRELVLPPALHGRFSVEPKWVDLRAFRASASATDRLLIERGADFAAHIRGMPKEDLLSEEVRQQARALALAWSAVALLAVLVAGVAVEWQIARRNAQQANELLVAQQEAADGMLLNFSREFGGRQGMPAAALADIADKVTRLFETDRAIVGDRPGVVQNHAEALVEFSQKIAGHDPGRAAEAAQKAIDLLRALPNDMPGVTRDLAAAHASLGSAQLKVDFARAAAAFAEELRLAETLEREAPAVLAIALADQARIDLARCDFAGARAAYDRILALWRRRHPGEERAQSAAARKELMGHYRGFAVVLAASGAPDDALTRLHAARQIGEALTAQAPDDLDAQDRLAGIYEALSDLLADREELAPARDAAQRAAAIAQKLVAQDDFRDDWKFNLAAALVREADLERRLARPEAAERLFAGARALLDRLDTTAFAAGNRHGNAVTLLKAAETEQALAHPEQALVLYRRAILLFVALADARWTNETQKAFGDTARLLLAEGRPAEAFAAMQDWVRFVEEHFPAETERRARALGTLAWYGVLARRPEDAFAAAVRSEALVPGIWWVSLNKAHALMAGGQDDAARAAYRALAERMRKDTTDISADVRADFTQLRRIGVMSALMPEVEQVFLAAAQGATRKPHDAVPAACAR